MSGHSKWSEVKRRNGADEADRRREIAIAACPRMIAQGDRPLFRVTVQPAEIGWSYATDVLSLSGHVARRGGIRAAARGLVAGCLELDADSFEIALPGD